MNGDPQDPTQTTTGTHRLPVARGRLPRAADPTEVVPQQVRLGPYVLLEQLGEGGMGVVHLAKAPNGDDVAIKVLRSHVAYDSKARDRLRREVETLSRVRAPGIAQVVDADVDGDHPYLVTQYVPGPPLDEVIDGRGPLDPRQLAALGRGLAEALRAIHRSGVVHRDVKPGNVLMVGDEPVLIDFGIAHIADESRLTQTGLVMGTPGYLSPEIIDGADVGAATDWWGWAATLAYAASGRAPFGKGPMPVVLDRVARGQADLSGVDSRIRPLLGAALSPEPGDRPTSAEILQELDVFARGGTTGAIVQRRVPHPATTPLHRKAVPVRPQQPPTDHLAAPAQPGWDQGVVGRPRDPRIGQPARSWTLLCLALAGAGLATILPIVAWVMALGWVFAARWNDKTITSMVLRQYAAGKRRSDTAIAWALSPWHAVVAAFSTLLVVIVPAFLGAVAGVLTAIAEAVGGLTASVYDRPLAIGVGTLVALWASWWGPGGTATRRGSRTLVRAISPNRQIATGLVIGLAAVAVLTALLAFSHLDSPLNWWPYSSGNQVPGSDLIPSMPSGW
ncbi:serine/threonine-protein kinase [Calidifontibacter terrae]